MDTLSYKTLSVNKENSSKEWVVIDATDLVLGRLASRVAILLRGKNKPNFTPNADCGQRHHPQRRQSPSDRKEAH